MIEFDGYITGEAERYYWNNSRKIARNALLAAAFVFFPLVLIVSSMTGYWLLTIGYCVLALAIPAILLIPQSKKSKLPLTPKKIFTDNEYIVCQGDNFEEYRLIEDVDKVIDYANFYYICFPFGNKSDKFVCQKSLIAKGTIEEFEALFEGKIERRDKNACIQ